MTTLGAATLLLLLTATAYWTGRRRALAVSASGRARLHSRPAYHGAYVAFACALAGLPLLAVSPWLALVSGAALAALAWTRVSPALRARPAVESMLRVLFGA